MGMARASGLIVLLTLLAALVAPVVRADEVADLSEQLVQAKDFRIRTQAALALGASKTKRAVSPLCQGLRDENPTVRAAAAAALGKLRKGGVQCLKKQLADEKHASVRKIVLRSIQRLQQPVPPAITEAHRYYLVLEIKDETGRTDGAATKVARRGAYRSAAQIPELYLARHGISDESASADLAKHTQLKGFLLSTKVLQPVYADGALTVKLEVAIFSYPDRNLQGTYSRTLTIQGLTTKNESSENELIEAGGERIIEMFAQTAARLR